MAIKNIVFDLGDVLVYTKNLNWFITPRFYEIVNKEYIDEEKLKLSFKNNMYNLTQKPNTEEEDYKLNPEESIFIDDRKDLLDMASNIGFNVLLMDRNYNIISDKYKVINKLEEIE